MGVPRSLPAISASAFVTSLRAPGPVNSDVPVLPLASLISTKTHSLYPRTIKEWKTSDEIVNPVLVMVQAF